LEDGGEGGRIDGGSVGSGRGWYGFKKELLLNYFKKGAITPGKLRLWWRLKKRLYLKVRQRLTLIRIQCKKDAGTTTKGLYFCNACFECGKGER